MISGPLPWPALARPGVQHLHTSTHQKRTPISHLPHVHPVQVFFPGLFYIEGRLCVRACVLRAALPTGRFPWTDRTDGRTDASLLPYWIAQHGTGSQHGKSENIQARQPSQIACKLPCTNRILLGPGRSVLGFGFGTVLDTGWD